MMGDLVNFPATEKTSDYLACGECWSLNWRIRERDGELLIECAHCGCVMDAGGDETT